MTSRWQRRTHRGEEGEARWRQAERPSRAAGGPRGRARASLGSGKRRAAHRRPLAVDTTSQSVSGSSSFVLLHGPRHLVCAGEVEAPQRREGVTDCHGGAVAQLGTAARGQSAACPHHQRTHSPEMRQTDSDAPGLRAVPARMLTGPARRLRAGYCCCCCCCLGPARCPGLRGE
jgi:hypothetical protein